MFDSDTVLSSLYELLVGFLPKVVGVIFLLIVTWTVARWLGNRTTRVVEKRLEITLARFFGSLVRYGIIIMGVLGCLRIFGFETTSFAAVLGAAGLAVGLAMQGTLSNFSAGVMLLAFRPFKVGDVVGVAGVTGKVAELSLFTTTFDTPDNRRIIVPNGQIFGSTIENITFHDVRRVDIAVGTDYGADLDRTRAALMEAALSVEGTDPEREPQVFLKDLGDSAIGWSVRVWGPTASYWDLHESTTRAVKKRLDEVGIGIPYPQMDVHVQGDAGS